MKPPRPTKATVTGVILAGGLARRMGGIDKGLIHFAGHPLVEWVIDALAPQVDALLINANRHLDIYAAYGLPVVQDLHPGFQGPLAGILSTMRAASTPWILTLPCDGPTPPPDLLERLTRALVREDAELAVAHDGQRLQAIHSLLPVSLADRLQAFLSTNERKVEHWHTDYRIAVADFSDNPSGFVNLNALAEVHEHEQALAQTSAMPEKIPHRQ